MQPFFYFSFFTFEYTSPVLTGSSPNFDIRKQFEVELTDQFSDYMKTQLLKIDLIDESVDISKSDARDYIGSARISLKELLLRDREEITDFFPVKDENGNENGRMEVRVTCKDYADTELQENKNSFVISKFAEREIVGKIAEKFADSMMESIDMIFDMLIEVGSNDTQKVSKRRFKDYILQIMDNSVREQDVDILLKANTAMAGKEFIEVNDFRSMFENPVREAKQRKIEAIAERDKTFQ